MRKVRSLCLLPLFTVLASPAVEAQPAFQVKDLNTTRSQGINHDFSEYLGIDSAVALGSVVFFPATDGIYGTEPWRSDGTEAGTRRIADLCPGSCSSGPSQLTVAGDRVFFLASDGLHGQALWKSDGTEADTVRVLDLPVRNGFARLSGFPSLDGLLVFSVSAYGSRQELWRSDGTEAGTFLLAEFDASSSENEPRPLGRLGGNLLFMAGDQDHGREVWTTDGTVAGTFLLKDIVPGPGDSAPGNLRAAVLGNKLLFTAADASQDYELWVSDGTAAGTVRLKDLYPGIQSSSPDGFTAAGGKVFFLANDSLGLALWKSDGTAGGTLRLRSLPWSVGPLAEAGGRLFFFLDCELWTSDGTEAGTVLVKDVRFGATFCFFPFVLGSGPELLFSAADATHGRELWKSDGTAAGTSRVADLYPGAGSSFNEYARGAFADGRWYFRAKGGEDVGVQLWTTDATAAGTRMLHINRQESGLALTSRGQLAGPRAFFDLDGTLLFSGDDGSTGAELWKSDGTAAGTSLVQDLIPGSSYPGELTRVGDAVFFRTYTGYSHALWKTDGTSQGTQLLRHFDSLYNLGGSPPRDLNAVGDLLLFAGGDYYGQLMTSDGTPDGTTELPIPSSIDASIVSRGDLAFFDGVPANWQNGQRELWKSDGTEVGTSSLGVAMPPWRLLKESSALRNGTLLFAGLDSEHGEELWQSDGTVAGTSLLAETVAGPDSKPLGPFATAGATVFFVAGGDELWKNDAGGTSLVRALPGNPTIGIRSLTAAGGRVFFTYDDGTHGRELWVSDGTLAGTRIVEDLFPGPGSSHPRELHAQGSILVFSASDGVHGFEPWRSDGTAVGTRMLADIAPGALPSSPTEFTASGPNLYFGANDGTTGFELWALPHPALLSTFADVPADAWSWSFVEALVANGLTQGCAPDLYCPGQAVTRAEAAVFLMRALALTQPPPPPGSGINFEDVPPSHWAWNWITQFAAQGYTSGCAPNRFCPESPISRAELAVFLLRVKHGASYVPPPATGTRFTDVPANHWVASWIEQLAAEGITSGCAANLFCPGQAVTRAEMAAFLVRTFGLQTP